MHIRMPVEMLTVRFKGTPDSALAPSNVSVVPILLQKSLAGVGER